MFSLFMINCAYFTRIFIPDRQILFRENCRRRIL
nr:MAG TPA: hypothetical protein [Caudoviricetes sp.]